MDFKHGNNGKQKRRTSPACYEANHHNSDCIDGECTGCIESPAALTDERLRFEKWYGNQENCLDRDDGGYYIRGDVQNDWEVWQAAMRASKGGE